MIFICLQSFWLKSTQFQRPWPQLYQSGCPVKMILEGYKLELRVSRARIISGVSYLFIYSETLDTLGLILSSPSHNICSSYRYPPVFHNIQPPCSSSQAWWSGEPGIPLILSLADIRRSAKRMTNTSEVVKMLRSFGIRLVISSIDILDKVSQVDLIVLQLQSNFLA